MKPVADGLMPADRCGFACEHQEGGLKDILGIVPVVQHALPDVKNHRSMPLNQRRERFFIALNNEAP